MQWQTNLPLIAILRGITPEEALAHVGRRSTPASTPLKFRSTHRSGKRVFPPLLRLMVIRR